MSDRWENRKAETERRVRLAIKATTKPGHAVSRWDVGGDIGTVWQTLDPDVYGLGILYSVTLDDTRIMVVRFRDGSSDYFSVEAIEPTEHPEFGLIHRAFYSTDVRVPLPKDLASFGNETSAEVSMTGGGTRDPYKVGLAARVLALASALAMHLDEQMKANHAIVVAPDGTTHDPVVDGRTIPTLTPARFHTMVSNDRFVVVQMKPKNGRNRTHYGNLVSIEQRDDMSISAIYVEDKAGRRHVLDVELIARLTTGGNDGKTLIADGQMAEDVWGYSR